mmetsp:Transcript_119039/g.370833  ORF Transcript_119039/g.370833 Transcript_119039/m.370833 type:complete len:324 (+) Transcript_119039:723-1694(+)
MPVHWGPSWPVRGVRIRTRSWIEPLRQQHAIYLLCEEKEKHVQVHLLDEREDLRHELWLEGLRCVAARHPQEEHVPHLEGVLRHRLIDLRPGARHLAGQPLDLHGPQLGGAVREEEGVLPAGGAQRCSGSCVGPQLRQALRRAGRAAGREVAEAAAPAAGGQQLRLAVQQPRDVPLDREAGWAGLDGALDQQQDDRPAQGLQDEVGDRHRVLAAAQELLRRDEGHHEPDVAKMTVLGRDHAVELVEVHAQQHPQEGAQAVEDVPRQDAVVLRAAGRDEEVVDLGGHDAAGHDADDAADALPDRAPEASSVLSLGAQNVGGCGH